MTKTEYVVRDREAGNIIERFETYDEAVEALKEYERIDKEEGIYTEDFYEIAKKEEGIYTRHFSENC